MSEVRKRRQPGCCRQPLCETRLEANVFSSDIFVQISASNEDTQTHKKKDTSPTSTHTHALLPVSTRVARFFLVQCTKMGKTYQITTKYTKCPWNIPNGCKMDQMSTKYNNIFKPLPNLAKLGFFGLKIGIPSGNPGFNVCLLASSLPLPLFYPRVSVSSFAVILKQDFVGLRKIRLPQ
jgi:hypothetical protein